MLNKKEIEGLSTPKIKEYINELINNIEENYDNDDVIHLMNNLNNDSRKGVIALGNRLCKKIAEVKNEIKRVKSMYEFDRSFAGNRIIAGVDEVGRGPLAGPIVSAAVVLNLESIDDKEIILGIKDSKKLSLTQREKLYDIIIEEATAYSISVIDNKEIDKKGIAWCNNEIFKQDILNLNVKPDFVLCDGYAIKDFHIDSEAIIKGDNKSASIACASIIAKVYRDRLMFKYNEEFPQYDFINNVGYGTKKHIEALKQFGPCEIHRNSFIKNFI